MVKAYAITTIHRTDTGGKLQVIPASTPQKVSVFNADKKEFDDLEALGGVREATNEEIAVAKSQAEQNGNAAFDDNTVAGNTSDSATTGTSQQPNSGAHGDPNAKPAKATSAKASSAKSTDDDLNL